MEIEPFSLERWFDQYEHDADIMLAESGIRSLDSSEFDTDPGELGYVIPTDGDPEFKAEIAARYDRGPEEIAFTCGTQEANFLAVLAAMGEDSHAVIVTPTYQSLQAVPDAVGEISRVWLEPPDWNLDVEEVREAIRPETELVVLNNPNNPTGRYHSRETVEALYDIAAANDACLLCDEVYRLLADDPLPPVASMGEHGISTTSLTKAYGLAGLRFGWLCGPNCSGGPGSGRITPLSRRRSLASTSPVRHSGRSTKPISSPGIATSPHAIANGYGSSSANTSTRASPGTTPWG